MPGPCHRILTIVTILYIQAVIHTVPTDPDPLQDLSVHATQKERYPGKRASQYTID